jgi:hypothetical protein
MGDAGSTFLGFSLSSLALMGAKRSPAVPVAVVFLALSPFLLDGTFTILRRLLRREAIWKPHRSHLYQRAVSTGLAHRSVLLPYGIWIVLAASSAVVAQHASTLVIVLAAGLMFAVHSAIWLWVVQREKRQRATSQKPALPHPGNLVVDAGGKIDMAPQAERPLDPRW